MLMMLAATLMSNQKSFLDLMLRYLVKFVVPSVNILRILYTLFQDMEDDEVCMLMSAEIEEIAYSDEMTCTHKEFESCHSTFKSVLRKSMVIATEPTQFQYRSEVN